MDQCIPITTVRNRTVRKRTCPICTNDVSSKNFARHVRTCRGPKINGRRECKICKKWILTKSMARHIARNHKNEDQDELRKRWMSNLKRHVANQPPNEDHDELTKLRTDNRRLLEKLSEKNGNKKRRNQLRVSGNKNRTVKSSLELPHSECSYVRPIFTPEHRARILDSQGNVCAMCKFKPTHIQIFTTMAVDHIKEKQELGYFDNSRDNLQVLCHGCNNSKARDLSWALKQKATKLRKDKKFKRQLEHRRLESIISSDSSSSSSSSSSFSSDSDSD